MPILQRLNITVSNEAARLLDFAKNKSRYIDQVIQERWTTWQAAMNTIERAQLTTNETFAICDVLVNCYMPGEYLSGPRIAIEMFDASNRGEGPKRLPIHPQRWQDIANHIAANGELAHALIVIARELRIGEIDAVKVAIKRLDQLLALG